MNDYYVDTNYVPKNTSPRNCKTSEELLDLCCYYKSLCKEFSLQLTAISKFVPDLTVAQIEEEVQKIINSQYN